MTKCVGLFKYTFMASVFYVSLSLLLQGCKRGWQFLYARKFRTKLLKLKIWHGCLKKIQQAVGFCHTTQAISSQAAE